MNTRRGGDAAGSNHKHGRNGNLSRGSGLFIATLYGIPLGFPQYMMIILPATLGSIGTAGVPGAGLIMLAMVLQGVGLPLEGLGLIAGIDVILLDNMGSTCLNVTGDVVCTTVVSYSEKGEHENGGSLFGIGRTAGVTKIREIYP